MLRDCLSDSQLLVAMALVTGGITGVAAYLLKRLVAFISTSLIMNLDPCGANWMFLLFPVAGILLTGIYQRYVLRKKIYHGVSQLGMAISERRYRLPGYLTYAPIVASSLTLGFGGSAGAEGPMPGLPSGAMWPEAWACVPTSCASCWPAEPLRE